MADLHPIENWLPVPGFERAYEVSDLGKVRSLTRMGSTGMLYVSREIRGFENNAGYRMVGLHDDGKTVRWLVHRIVASAFLGPCPGPEFICRHMNGDSTDNRAVNLRWGTRSENYDDSRRHGTGNFGQKSIWARTTEAQAKDAIRLRAAGLSYSKIAKITGATVGAIASIARGKTWKHLPR